MTGLCKVCRAMISDRVPPGAALGDDRAAVEFGSMAEMMYKHLFDESRPLRPRAQEHQALLQTVLGAQGAVGSFLAAQFLETANPQYAGELARARAQIVEHIQRSGRKQEAAAASAAGEPDEDFPPAA